MPTAVKYFSPYNSVVVLLTWGWVGELVFPHPNVINASHFFFCSSEVLSTTCSSKMRNNFVRNRCVQHLINITSTVSSLKVYQVYLVKCYLSVWYLQQLAKIYTSCASLIKKMQKPMKTNTLAHKSVSWQLAWWYWSRYQFSCIVTAYMQSNSSALSGCKNLNSIMFSYLLMTHFRSASRALLEE